MRNTLRASVLWEIVPGEILVVKPHKQWIYDGHPYLSGEIESARIDVAAINFTPLSLQEQGKWDPKDAYWSKGEDCIDEYIEPIIAHGMRQAYEMEQVAPT